MNCAILLEDVRSAFNAYTTNLPLAGFGGALGVAAGCAGFD
jgi:hypothetical protein